jgi:hypothetical protein
MTQLQESLEHPVMRRVYPPDLVDASLRIWAAREELAAALDRLPRTLCHGDTTRRNLFARRSPDGSEQTIAIDWAGVGTGWIGWEMRQITRSTLLLREVDWADAEELERMVFDGYLVGLRDAGWRGDPRLVRLGLAGENALMSMGLNAGVFRVLVDRRHPNLIRDWGLTIEGAVDHVAECVRTQLNLGNEALQLLDEM